MRPAGTFFIIQLSNSRVFVVCFLLLSILSMLYKKQSEKLENQYGEEVKKNYLVVFWEKLLL